MSIYGGCISITGISFLMFSVFLIAALGCCLGRVVIKGVSLGAAGVFVVALLYGAFFSNTISSTIIQTIPDSAAVDISVNALKIVENIGLILFVTSVGFIAGPSFIKNLKKNFRSYIALGLAIILAGGLSCIACYFIGHGMEANTEEFVAILAGLLSGAMTSTPAFSAAKATVAPEFEGAVIVGYGIAYLFGVIGVVLFVQVIPKLLHADIEAERKKIVVVDVGNEKQKYAGKLIDIDQFGLMAFSLAAALGVLVGNIKIPFSTAGLSGSTFSLTATGGTMLVALVFGHFGHLGPINVTINKSILKIFSEFGLLLFLIGAGASGGAKFVIYFKAVYFLYGMLMTIFPMTVGFLFAKYVLKLSLFNNLGSVTGGMTSTPALGTLIKVANTDDVASAYAATYPIALITVVLITQFFIILF